VLRQQYKTKLLVYFHGNFEHFYNDDTYMLTTIHGEHILVLA